ncbi:MAG TPA: hypothetical protein VN656_15415 [Stellaceae bacterium]|jgi:hypothetical protein|nr:hypothetical protein [Stellaceae bacterium]
MSKNLFFSIAAVAALVIAPATRGITRQQTSPPAERSGTNAPSPVPASFLPDYYALLLALPKVPLHLASHDEKDKQQQYVFASDDQVITLTIEKIRCDDALCTTVYNNAVGYLDNQATPNKGKFRVVTPTEFRVDWQVGLGSNAAFVFRLRSSVLFWSYSTRLERHLDLDQLFKQLTQAVDRQRYEEAKDDNIEMGHWGAQAHAYADTLLRAGRKSDALAVLTNVLTSSPFDYQAHIEIAENTDDRAAAQDHARIVMKNAEDQALLERAAKILGTTLPAIGDLPVLDQNERGLQLILIPLPPCNVLLLQEAAQIYQKITDIPVKIMRLPDPWRFGVPERIPDQKAIQRTIIQAEGPTVDFTAWTKQKYQSELLKTVVAKDALMKFQMKSYVDKLDERPGQYLIGPYLTRLANLLAKYRSFDGRTMYVGVTAENLYNGDLNYVFSSGLAGDRRATSMLS